MRKGDLEKHMKEKAQKAKTITKQIKIIGSQKRCGSESVRVQLELYRKWCASSNLLWHSRMGKIKGNEAMEIERIQAEALKQMLDLPTSRPYVGVLMETGIWPAMDQLNYATLMFYHSVINSEERLVTKIVLEQEATSRANTFTERVKKIGEVLGIDTLHQSL